VNFTDPVLRASLHSTVDSLAVAKKKLANAEEEAAKVQPLTLEVNRIKSELMKLIDNLGFTEEAIELLLAAR